MKSLLNRRILTACACALGTLFFVTSCEDDTSSYLSVEEPVSQTTPDFQQKIDFLRSTGFEQDSIAYRDGDFVIDGDILISEQDIEQRLAAYAIENSRTAQRRSQYIVDQARVKDVKVAFKTGSDYVGQTTENAYVEAMDQWSDIVGTTINFRKVTYSPGAYDIVVYKSSQPTLADSRFPSNSGAPGYEIRVNVNATSIRSYALQVRIAGHELGHTIGLDHTNDVNLEPNSSIIPGTPESEGRWSIMNSSVFEDNPFFTDGDIKAAQILYPILLPDLWVRYTGNKSEIRVAQGNTTRLEVDVSNIGNVCSSNFTLETFVSTSSTFNSLAQKMGTGQNRPGLCPPYGGDVQTARLQIATYSKGTYYIHIVADKNNSIEELDEVNNIMTMPLVIY